MPHYTSKTTNQTEQQDQPPISAMIWSQINRPFNQVSNLQKHCHILMALLHSPFCVSFWTDIAGIFFISSMHSLHLAGPYLANWHGSLNSHPPCLPVLLKRGYPSRAMQQLSYGKVAAFINVEIVIRNHSLNRKLEKHGQKHNVSPWYWIQLWHWFL